MITRNPVSEARENRGSGNKPGWGFTDEQWTKIFGTTKPKISEEEKGKGLKDIPTRGDYDLCRDCNKTIKDYIKFKDPRDREKIKDEYFGKQADYRKRRDVRERANEMSKWM